MPGVLWKTTTTMVQVPASHAMDLVQQFKLSQACQRELLKQIQERVTKCNRETPGTKTACTIDIL